MLMALGFLIATLFAIIAAQFVWRRAVNVTTRRLAEDDGEAEMAAKTRELDNLLLRQEREQKPLLAELETLRAEHRQFAAANEELATANTELSSKNKDLENELARLNGEIASLRTRLDNAAAEAATRTERLAAVRRELDGLETAMANEAQHYETAAAAPSAPAPAPAPAPAMEQQKSETLQTHTHAPAPAWRDDADADARTLAEVKASLARLDAMGVDNPQAFENMDETPEDETDDDAAAGEPVRERTKRTATPTNDAYTGDKALTDRIRALEAGVAP